MKNYEYPGAIHIHSKYSDGSASIEDIARYAKKAGLKWVIITDHNTLGGLKDGKEGFYDGVCVLIGVEISPETGNHYLAFDIYEDISEELPPEKVIQAVNEKGGIGFIAHPDELPGRKNNYPPLRWEDWSINGFQGLEIWNFMSDWVDTLNAKNKLKKYLKPVDSLHGPTQKVINWWDRLNNKSNTVVPGIFSLDEHSFKFKYFGMRVKVFSPRRSFKTLLNYIQTNDILSRDFEIAKKQIYGAIKGGHNIMVNKKRGAPEGSVFTATKIHPQKKFVKATVGESLKITDDFIIDIETPSESEIKLYHNGRVVKQEITSHLKYKSTEPGSYRYEAYVNGRHWIISNPIKVIKTND